MSQNVKSHEKTSQLPLLAFNTTWLKENLTSYLWREQDSPGEVAEVEILHLWESAKRVTVLYRTELKAQDGRTFQQGYVGYVVPEQRMADEHKSVVKKAWSQPPLGRAVTLVPEASLILLSHPNDRKMRLFTEADLRAWVSHHLRKFSQRFSVGSRWTVDEVKMETLRYVPDRRCTSLCRISIGSDQGQTQEVRFIAKQLNDEKKARSMFRNLRSLRRAWIEKRDRKNKRNHDILPIRFPMALAWHPEKAVVFIEEMPGVNLMEALPGIDAERIMSSAGRLLATFQKAQKRVRKKVTIKNELAEVREAAQIIVEKVPHFRVRMRRLYKQLKVATNWQNKNLVALLHGTYRLNHILIDGDELALLDMDSLRMGHPAYDVANFISSLFYLEAQQRLTDVQRREIVRHFLEGYASATTLNVDPAAVLWFLASLLVNKQAKKYVSHLHDDCEDKVERMLAIAERALDIGAQMPANMTLDALWKVLP